MSSAAAVTNSLICVAGVYVKSDKYPNVKYKLLGLQNSNVRYSERNFPVFSTSGSWGKGRSFAKVFGFIVASVRAVGSIIHNRKRFAVFYIPYPGISVCFLLSFIPRSFRPKSIFLDMFISMYDTVVLDRRLFRKDSKIARALYWVERRCMAVAEKIVVDTPQNALFYSELFKFPVEMFHVSTLAIGDQCKVAPSGSSDVNQGADVGFLEVLFLGTMVPLHGVEYILSAAKILRDEKIRFTFVGDGQQSYLLERYLKENISEKVIWYKDWKSQSEIAALIDSADICLGIFSTSSKAQRVCPLKLYHYMKVGKAIITGETDWAKGLRFPVDCTPFMTVRCGDANGLAKAMLVLLNDREKREGLASRSREFYSQHLTDEIGTAQLAKLLLSEVNGGEA